MRENNSEIQQGFSLTLSRQIKLKRYPIIAKIVFEREREDLVNLLKSMKDNSNAMIPRLKEYLKKEKLWDEQGITEKGHEVIANSLFCSPERGLYHIWYADDDKLLGTRPLFMQRDNAFFEPKVDVWKKDNVAENSEFKVTKCLQLNAMEERYDHEGNKTILEKVSLQMSSLIPEVICSNQKEGSLELEWLLDSSNSLIQLHGRLDMLQFNSRTEQPIDKPEQFNIEIQIEDNHLPVIMNEFATKLFSGRWNADQPMETVLEKLEDYSDAVQNLYIDDFEKTNFETRFGNFDIQAQKIPIQPQDQSEAEKWHQYWLEKFYSKSYQPSKDARQKQAEWIDHNALKNFELPFKDQAVLLENLSRESHPEAYWHAAAIADLSPEKSKKLRMPLSLADCSELDLKSLINKLSSNENVKSFIYSDRYVRNERQVHNLTEVNKYLNCNEGILFTLQHTQDEKIKLPQNWSKEIFKKESVNHGRFWIFICSKDVVCWECSIGLDFICNNEDEGFRVDGLPTFTPKERNDLPFYLQTKINSIMGDQ